jgi:Flp pilus assembly protein TadD
VRGATARRAEHAARACHDRRVIARVALVVCALVVAGLLAFTLHAVRLEAEAKRVVRTGPTPDRVARADKLLRDAARHNPDIRPEFGRGLLLGAANRNEESAAIFRDLARKEPDNIRVAVALAGALTRLRDPGAAQAFRHVRELAPPVTGH